MGDAVQCKENPVCIGTLIRVLNIKHMTVYTLEYITHWCMQIYCWLSNPVESYFPEMEIFLIGQYSAWTDNILIQKFLPSYFSINVKLMTIIFIEGAIPGQHGTKELLQCMHSSVYGPEKCHQVHVGTTTHTIATVANPFKLSCKPQLTIYPCMPMAIMAY